MLLGNLSRRPVNFLKEGLAEEEVRKAADQAGRLGLIGQN